MIGKYVYIRYLWDRKIITEEWLSDHKIRKSDVLERSANREGLTKLARELEKRFNGNIFDIDFDGEGAPEDLHISLTASVFMGDVFESDQSYIIQQLHLDFQAYEFEHIPVETLSAVYEQFIVDSKKKGAVYTPEMLAEYLLSEVHTSKPLFSDMKILDPSCGSGVFLVLAYRRIIEQELSKNPRKYISPAELSSLLDNIYGIERELDACYVTEFSLILTMLSYIDTDELNRNQNFRFPNLHNKCIFHGDFFDFVNVFIDSGIYFDFIVGNPPWVQANKSEQPIALTWINQNENERPVGSKSVAEAFSWRAVDILKEDGIIGLVMPALSLVNLSSEEYRVSFFKKHEVIRITNFAHLREILFNGRSESPAATFIYRKYFENHEKKDILHYGPFPINQLSVLDRRLWVITINENEIKRISYNEIEVGRTSTWKLALWGNHQDKRAIERLRKIFPMTLEQICTQRNWGARLPRQGAEFCDDPKKPKANIAGKKTFDTSTFNNFKPRRRFTIPDNVLHTITTNSYVRRGEDTLLLTTPAPHIILSKGWDFIIYSDKDFVIPPQQMCISAPEEDADYLRALSIYLNSSLVRYYLFFQVPEWGFYRRRESVVVTAVRQIPTPKFTTSQVQELSAFQREAMIEETQAISLETQMIKDIQIKLQERLDEIIFTMFRIPKDITTLVKDFVKVRLPLDGSKGEVQNSVRRPNEEDLRDYAIQMRDKLDNFLMGRAYHKIGIIYSRDLIECSINIIEDSSGFSEVNVVRGEMDIRELLSNIRDSIGEEFSQWIYIYRGLRLFDGPSIRIYKLPTLINWTKTQAMNDAIDIIGQLVSTGISISVNN